MDNTKLFLKPSVRIEPLIWKWYAWAHLIAPTTAAMNIANRHIRIMESFINNPEVHVTASKNPKMLGGPFINLDMSYVKEVKDLLQWTQENCTDLINLASAIHECDTKVIQQAKGGSMRELYLSIPPALQGMVELVYDLNSQPSLRFIENLIYKLYFREDFHSIKLFNTQEDKRNFVLSTPQLERNYGLEINRSFSDPNLDKIFSMHESPRSYNEVIKILDTSLQHEPLLKEFFTDVKPRQPSKFRDENKVRIRYFGHGCILLESNNITILTDPVVSYEYPTTLPRFTICDLPEKIDYVLLSHAHQDHVLLETLLRIRYKIENIVVPASLKGSLVDPSLKLILQYLGFKSVLVLDDLESIKFSCGEIIGLPFFGEHADLNIQSKLAYFVRLNDKKIIFAADSTNLSPELYKHIYHYYGTADIIFIGLECEGAPLTWMYGSLLTKSIDREYDLSRRLSGSNASEALNILQQFECKQAYVYAMGQEPWLNHIMTFKYDENSIQIKETRKFITECQKLGVECKLLYSQYEVLL